MGQLLDENLQILRDPKIYIYNPCVSCFKHWLCFFLSAQEEMLYLFQSSLSLDKDINAEKDFMSVKVLSFFFALVIWGHGVCEKDRHMQTACHYSEVYWGHQGCFVRLSKGWTIYLPFSHFYTLWGVGGDRSSPLFLLLCPLALLPPSALIWVDGVAVAWQDTCLGPCVRRLARSCWACFLCVTMSLPLSLLAPPSKPPLWPCSCPR